MYLSPRKQAHCPEIMTPIRVRGNSFPRALFLFLFYSLSGSYFDLDFFRTFLEKDWASRRWSKSRDKRPVWSGTITIIEFIHLIITHRLTKNETERVPGNCFPGTLFCAAGYSSIEHHRIRQFLIGMYDFWV